MCLIKRRHTHASPSFLFERWVGAANMLGLTIVSEEVWTHFLFATASGRGEAHIQSTSFLFVSVEYREEKVKIKQEQQVRDLWALRKRRGVFCVCVWYGKQVMPSLSGGQGKKQKATEKERKERVSFFFWMRALLPTSLSFLFPHLDLFSIFNLHLHRPSSPFPSNKHFLHLSLTRQTKHTSTVLQRLVVWC